MALPSAAAQGSFVLSATDTRATALLAQHPDVAAGINQYRSERLAAAEQHAADTGYQGARFPWESALDGTEQIPPPVSITS